MELRGREANLLAKKKQLESRILDLDSKIRAMGREVEIDPALAASLLGELKSLLGQTEQTLAGAREAAENAERETGGDKKPSAEEVPSRMGLEAGRRDENEAPAATATAEGVKITAKDATTGQTRSIGGLGPLDTVAALRAKVVATGLVSRSSHLLHNGKVLSDHQELGSCGVLLNPVVIVLDRGGGPEKPGTKKPGTGQEPPSPPVAAAAAASAASSPVMTKAASVEAAMKAAIKEEYAALVKGGMEKSLAVKEAIRRVKHAALK